MANFFVTGNSTTSYVLNAYSSGIITQTGTLYSGAAVCVTMTGASASLVNEGSIYGASTLDSAIVIDTTGASISNLGTIIGTFLTPIFFNQTIANADLSIFNSGLIQGQGASSSAIYSYGGNVDIVNEGTIQSTLQTAIALTGTLGSTLQNTGLISSPTNAVILGSGDDAISNQGIIEGDILLSSGDDIYDGIGGFLGGKINLGHGDDTARMGDNDDFIIGGRGADLIYGNGGIDTVSYAASSGVTVLLDKNRGTRGDALGDRLYDIENIIGGSYGDVLRGNDGVNDIAGYYGDDLIRGWGGNDELSGEFGDDRVLGDDGDDTIVGGDGRDTLTGGAGFDIFAYLAISDSTVTASGRDVIQDFTQGEDQIDLSALGVTSFAGAAFTGAGNEVRAFLAGAGDRINVQVDLDGDLNADFSVILLNTTATLTSDDFILG